MYTIIHFYTCTYTCTVVHSTQVLALFCLIACAVAEDDASHDDLDTGLLTRSNAAAGWGLFLCFVAMVTEVVIVLMRFLNCGFVSNFLTISMIVVSKSGERCTCSSNCL